jgi:hypothetical protein
MSIAWLMERGIIGSDLRRTTRQHGQRAILKAMQPARRERVRHR